MFEIFLEIVGMLAVEILLMVLFVWTLERWFTWRSRDQWYYHDTSWYLVPEGDWHRRGVHFPK